MNQKGGIQTMVLWPCSIHDFRDMTFSGPVIILSAWALLRLNFWALFFSTSIKFAAPTLKLAQMMQILSGSQKTWLARKPPEVGPTNELPPTANHAIVCSMNTFWKVIPQAPIPPQIKTKASSTNKEIPPVEADSCSGLQRGTHNRKRSNGARRLLLVEMLVEIVWVAAP